MHGVGWDLQVVDMCVRILKLQIASNKGCFQLGAADRIVQVGFFKSAHCILGTVSATWLCMSQPGCPSIG